MNNQSYRSVILNVPYSQKDLAKDLGARWDPDLKKWFVPQGIDPKPFRRWMQSEKNGESGKPESSRSN